MLMDSLFQAYVLNENGQKKAAAIAETFNILLTDLYRWMPLSGRETSIVRTKLEEAAFFAKKAMASQPENQQELR